MPPEGDPPPTLTVRPVPGLPEFAPGDDLAAAVATAAPWLADGDVVVVTSKVVSKVEGNLVAVPPGPTARWCASRRSTPRPCGWSPAAAR